MSDIIFHRDNYIFDYRVAGILVYDNRVLLQAPKNTGEYALPGGHAALGETNAETLIREWREEVGVDITVGDLKWVEENLFSWGDKKAHQISLSYIVKLKDRAKIPLTGSFVSREYKTDDDNAIWFHWLSIDELKRYIVYPAKAPELLSRLDEGVQHSVYREGG